VFGVLKKLETANRGQAAVHVFGIAKG